MAEFTARERLIAGMLSAMPGVKQAVKKVYVSVNALTHRKGYTQKVFMCDAPVSPVYGGEEESFFGYYDKCPANGRGDVLMYLTSHPTRRNPSASLPITVAVSMADGTLKKLDATYAYNWQQGARAQWLTDDLIIYNVFEDNAYKAKVYSLEADSVVRTYDWPVQDAFANEYFLAIDYERIMAVRPDYGYRNRPRLTDEELMSTRDVGIRQVNIATGEVRMLIAMDDIVACDHKEVFDRCVHVVNHLMISPEGRGLIFVHRFYEGKRRHDRLMYWNGADLKVLMDEDMVSHYCWVSEDELFGYMRCGGVNGFFFVNVKTGETRPCAALNVLSHGDGHPTCCGSRIIVDTYPDKSRMQHLMLYDMPSGRVEPIAEVYQSVRYMNQTRCDLHPRFGRDGKSVFFDSVFSGKRQLCKLDL